MAEVARRLTDTGLTVETHVVVATDSVAKSILDFAKRSGPSLIAMSTHGRGASRLFLGSVSDKVFRAGTAPMLLFRPPRTSAKSAPDESGVASEGPALRVV